MEYDDFANLAQRQDTRNTFRPCDTDLSFVPVPLRLFYTLYNPVEVEIVMRDSTSVRFCPVQYLKHLQEEYSLDNAAFIFATQEGDPIYYSPEGIFVCTHGSVIKQGCRIADSFEDFLETLKTGMMEVD